MVAVVAVSGRISRRLHDWLKAEGLWEDGHSGTTHVWWTDGAIRVQVSLSPGVDERSVFNNIKQQVRRARRYREIGYGQRKVEGH